MIVVQHCWKTSRIYRDVRLYALSILEHDFSAIGGAVNISDVRLDNVSANVAPQKDYELSRRKMKPCRICHERVIVSFSALPPILESDSTLLGHSKVAPKIFKRHSGYFIQPCVKAGCRPLTDPYRGDPRVDNLNQVCVLEISRQVSRGHETGGSTTNDAIRIDIFWPDP